MTETERRVIDTAMYEYYRLKRLGYDARTWGGSAKMHWLACRALAKLRRRSSTRSGK